MHRLQSHAREIFGTIASGSGAGAAVAAWQTQLAWGVTVLAGLVAITSGVLTIRSILRKERAPQP
jgi:hypothetical protein